MTDFQIRMQIDADDMQNIFGENDAYIRKIEDDLKVVITDRNGAVTISGGQSAVQKAARLVDELVEFSKEQVVIRKTYEQSTEDTGYYAVLENGYVTIYCGDKSSVYDYTNIAAGKLPEQILSKTIEGFYFNDMIELYEFLQTYSS